jgi:predicted alpha/beta hydrolase
MSAALRRPWKRWMTAPVETATERLWVRTQDGVRLHLTRVRPRGEVLGAVMLVHGLAANRFTFDCGGRSFPSWLAERGFDCFVPELRGAGESERPASGRWDLDDYLDLDIPALIDAIAGLTPAPLHWVGHSLGGIMLMLHGIRHPATAIKRGVAIGSALDYGSAGSSLEPMLRLRPLVERLRLVPFGTVMHLLAPALGRVASPLEVFNVWPPNIEPELIRLLHAFGFEDIQVPLLGSLVKTFEGGFVSRDGSFRYRERVRDLRVPVLLLGGTEDRQCPPAAIRATASALGPPAQLKLFGRQFGHAEDYGHVDLLLGKRAPDEVWPEIARWLTLR